MNNLKLIREIYMATQAEIGIALGVSRVTVAKWESEDANRISQANLEKLSLFYGVGPEFFYEKAIDEKIIKMIQITKIKANEVEEETSKKKEEDFSEIFSAITFTEAINKYMVSMKMLLALSDKGKIDDLEIVCKINEKMNTRLKSIIKIKRDEKDSIEELFEQLSFNEDKL